MDCQKKEKGAVDKGQGTLAGTFIILITLILFGLIYLQNNGGNTLFKKDCIDGTKNNACSNNTPYFCANGYLQKKATICGCGKSYETQGEECVYAPRCEDKTLYGECSENKPFSCLNGSLIQKPSKCGCPDEYKIEGDACEKIQRCSDKTIYGECSKQLPLICIDGSLTEKSSVCGCPENQTANGEKCTSKFLAGPDQRILEYTLRGKTNSILLTVYSGLDKYLANLSRTYYCRPDCPSARELEMRYLEDERQKTELDKIVREIKSLTDNRDDQARIATSLVQSIPYDSEGIDTNTLNNRYPYEVVYDQKGVCGEKSRLLAYLLRGLGYGTVLLEYKQENHMALGIKCPAEYAQYTINNTPYCFIETSQKSVITNSRGEYADIGKLVTAPVPHIINSGNTFATAEEEYDDAQEMQRLTTLGQQDNGKLDRPEYDRWTALTKKYSIQTTKKET